MAAQSPTWPLAFKGRGQAGTYGQNFVWKHRNVYVMDNHRAALWCWLQEVDLERPHSLFHIDRHSDALSSRLDEWLQNLPPWSATLEDYLSHSYTSDCGSLPVIRWDNYLSIYLAEFGENIDKFQFSTHGDGDDPQHPHVLKPKVWDLPANMEYWLDQSDSPWIMNIDIDYFFWGCMDESGRMLADDYLDTAFSPVRRAIENGAIAVTTVCLTPDLPYTPGWTDSERVAEKLLSVLGFDFRLPRGPSNNALHGDR